MAQFLICNNSACRFVLDRRINGAALDGVRKILKTCPACHAGWSSSCPFCKRPLDVDFSRGLPQTACCGRKLRPETSAVRATTAEVPSASLEITPR